MLLGQNNQFQYLTLASGFCVFHYFLTFYTDVSFRPVDKRTFNTAASHLQGAVFALISLSSRRPVRSHILRVPHIDQLFLNFTVGPRYGACVWQASVLPFFFLSCTVQPAVTFSSSTYLSDLRDSREQASARLEPLSPCRTKLCDRSC